MAWVLTASLIRDGEIPERWQGTGFYRLFGFCGYLMVLQDSQPHSGCRRHLIIAPCTTKVPMPTLQSWCPQRTWIKETTAVTTIAVTSNLRGDLAELRRERVFPCSQSLLVRKIRLNSKVASQSSLISLMLCHRQQSKTFKSWQDYYKIAFSSFRAKLLLNIALSQYVVTVLYKCFMLLNSITTVELLKMGTRKKVFLSGKQTKECSLPR